MDVPQWDKIVERDRRTAVSLSLTLDQKWGVNMGTGREIR